VRLGSPNSAVLPYKTGSTLQRTFADCGMGVAERREFEIGDSLIAGISCEAADLRLANGLRQNEGNSGRHIPGILKV
jgi:hypothetical protein